MSTLGEIEDAIQGLPPAQVEELFAWFDQYRRERKAGGDQSSPGSVKDFFGRFSSGDTCGADNQGIDADLTREAMRGL